MPLEKTRQRFPPRHAGSERHWHSQSKTPKIDRQQPAFNGVGRRSKGFRCIPNYATLGILVYRVQGLVRRETIGCEFAAQKSRSREGCFGSAALTGMAINFSKIPRQWWRRSGN